MKSRVLEGMTCEECKVVKLCLGSTVSDNSYTKLNHLIKYVQTYVSGEHLYLAPNKPDYLYALHSGCCKEYFIDQNGEEVITAFYLPGDLIGLEYCYKNYSRFNVSFVENSTVCLIPLSELYHENSYLAPITARQAISHYLTQVSLPHTTSAQSRVAAFFLELIYRQKIFYQRETPLPFPMILLDISNKIGVANETLSRMLHKFRDQHILVLEHHAIVNYDLAKLEEIAGVEFISTFYPSYKPQSKAQGN